MTFQEKNLLQKRRSLHLPERSLNGIGISLEHNLKELILGLKDELKIFYFLSNEEVEKLIPYFEMIRYHAGDTIFYEGDAGNFIGIVISGKLEVRKQTEFKGRQIILALLGQGSFVGELSFIDEQPRSATVIASEDSELIILRREALDSLMEIYPVIEIKILKGLNRILAKRLRKAVDRLAIIF